MREALNGIVCECMTDCNCIEELVKYKEMYQSIAGGANLNHLIKQNEELYLALSWSCRRLMYVHECYPDLLGPITLDKIARCRKDFNLEKK